MTQGKYSELTNERVMEALGGDREAFAEMYRCYGPTVRATVAAVIRHRPRLVAHFEDMVGEVWTRFLADGCKRLHSFDPRRGPFGFYLRMRTFAMARMIADQYLRRSKTVELNDPFHSTFGKDHFEDRLLGRDELIKLDEAVRERLGEVDAVLFDQVLVLGRVVGDVADELGLSRDATYRRSHRLKEKVARIAEDIGVVPSRTDPSTILALLIAFSAQSQVLPIEEIEPTMSELPARDR